MKPFKSFLLGAVISFWGAFLALPLLGWNIEVMAPQSDCSFFGEKKIQSGFLDRISLRFWVRACQPQNIFIGSSEATGDHSSPFYLQQKGYDFSYFVGAHRGIKTLGLSYGA